LTCCWRRTPWSRFQKLIFTIRPSVPTIHPACWFANDTFQNPRKSGSSFQVSPSSGDQATPPRGHGEHRGQARLVHVAQPEHGAEGEGGSKLPRRPAIIGARDVGEHLGLARQVAAGLPDTWRSLAGRVLPSYVLGAESARRDPEFQRVPALVDAAAWLAALTRSAVEQRRAAGKGIDMVLRGDAVSGTCLWEGGPVRHMAVFAH
jgi:hypothetical protein